MSMLRAETDSPKRGSAFVQKFMGGEKRAAKEPTGFMSKTQVSVRR
jgi:hypothetical protein